MRSVLFSLFLTLVLAGAAAGLAFIAGRTSADAPGNFERGVEEGERIGRITARAEFAPGSPDYEAALERGRKTGFDQGRRTGRAEGARRGRRSGRSAAFAGFEDGWEIGRWYIVAIAPAGEAGGDIGIQRPRAGPARRPVRALPERLADLRAPRSPAPPARA